MQLLDGKKTAADIKQEIAQKYFKGDKTVAKYYIIFKSIFPIKHKKFNSKWNKHFGFPYDGISLWDSHVRVAKKFHEIYRKKDIGLFIAGTYLYARDTVDIENEKCWMTKPYKFMNNYDQWYELNGRTYKKYGYWYNMSGIWYDPPQFDQVIIVNDELVIPPK